MKNWHQTLLTLFAGMLLIAAVQIASAPPRGAAVQLLPAPTSAPVTVHVTGAVIQPGLYTLPRESRLSDAVQSAGGMRPDANADAVNLAAVLKDGQKIVIPAIGEPVQPLSAADQGITGDSEAVSGAPVNINTATAEELESLPGVGATRALQIIAFREEHGGFQYIDDIQQVSGIGPATFENLKHLITVE
jgi:competence protein ComEA